MPAQSRTLLILVAAAVLLCGGVFTALSASGPKAAAAVPAPIGLAAAAAPASPAPAGFRDTVGLAESPAVQIRAALSHPLVTPGTREQYLMVKLSGESSAAAGRRVPVQLGLVLDCSGSMAGLKLEQTKAAASDVVRQLLPGDRVVLVAYETSADLLVPSTPIDEESRSRVLAAIARLAPLGSTNISGGLERARAAMLRDRAADRSVRRIVLLSDGQANVGETRPEALFASAALLREQGIALSSVGIGEGYNQSVMEGLAEHGGGRLRFLDEPAQAAQAFATELRLASQLVAADVRVVLHPADGTRIEDVYGHLFERVGDDVVVKVTDLAATTEVRVLARLSVGGNAGTVPVVEAVATFAEAASDRARVAARAPALTATFVADAAEADRASDREVLTYALNGRSIAEARRAMELYNAGKREEALASIDRATQQAEQANQRLQAKELTSSVGVFGNLRALFASSANALGGEESHQVQRKAIRNFGSNNTSKE